MSRAEGDKEALLAAIRKTAAELGHPPKMPEFADKLRKSRAQTQYLVCKYFPKGWGQAVSAAGLTPDTTTSRLSDDQLLRDWASLVRELRQIPTRNQYRYGGKYSPQVFERHFGPWSGIPDKFRAFAGKTPEWADVLVLLPALAPRGSTIERAEKSAQAARSGDSPIPIATRPHAKLGDRLMYGNPIDFRGLAHEPVNEQGVVFLFGMVAKELGYMVEAVQGGFPDCEAKRQVAPDRWQRVRIEFEFESRNFRDQGHDPNGCDVIVCWRHNWPERPPHLEVVELKTLIQSLAKSED